MCNKYHKIIFAANLLIIRGGVESLFVQIRHAATTVGRVVRFWMFQIRRFSGNLLHPFIFDTYF